MLVSGLITLIIYMVPGPSPVFFDKQNTAVGLPTSDLTGPFEFHTPVSVECPEPVLEVHAARASVEGFHVFSCDLRAMSGGARRKLVMCASAGGCEVLWVRAS